MTYIMYVQSQKIGKSTSLGVSKPNYLNRLAKNTYACGRRTLDFLTIAGADPGFQVRRGVVKKIAPSGGKKSYFSNFRGHPRVRPPAGSAPV
jgi:hypothetical protein